MLGICVVYLAGKTDGEFLLKMHLLHLASNTSGPYRIYGVALRLADPLVRVLQEGGVALPELPAFEPGNYEGNAKGSGEHSHYLDQLVDFAFQDGCTLVATFDMDSWPIAKAWDAYYRRFLSADIPVVAMQRVETGDNFPNPAFTLMQAGFWRTGKTSFAIFNVRDQTERQGIVISRPQSGAGIHAQLTSDGKKFLPLVRSNAWNPHPIMCGIYDRRIFHLGAGSRQPTFTSDAKEYDVIESEMSRSYARAINGAKRAFFIYLLKSSADEFLRQLALGPVPPTSD